jgi:hypothetical protein
MIKRRKVLSLIFASIFLAAGFFSDAQEKTCEVKHPGIAGTYSGDCRNGLANGRGVAQGIDKYYGQFRDGLPHGKGTYTWQDGTYYEGQWQYGMKEGKGKLVSKDSSLSGYWRSDKYVGEKLVPPYRITRSMSVVRSSFSRLPGPSNFVKIKFIRGGLENADIIDLSIANDSGEQYRIGPSYGIQNSMFPLEVIIRFRFWNYFHTAQSDAYFDFVINEPATWDVTISY